MTLQIVETNLQFTGPLTTRTVTNYLVIHHAAASVYSIYQVHALHISNGWLGCGYHYYIRKDGVIYRGRPEDKIGAHVEGYNSQSVGICLEGNFEVEQPTNQQIASLNELLTYLKQKYPGAQIVGHNQLNNTACPGRYFPWNKIHIGTNDPYIPPVYPIVIPNYFLIGAVMAGAVVLLGFVWYKELAPWPFKENPIDSFVNMFKE